MIVSSSFASSALLRPVLSSPPLLSSWAALPVPLFHQAQAQAQAQAPAPAPAPAPAQAQAQTDVALHGWCDSVGIPVSPSVRLRTTPESVAGRGETVGVSVVGADVSPVDLG